MTKAYSVQQVQEMRAELRAVDAHIVNVEALTRSDDPETRRQAKVALKAYQRAQKSLADKVWRIAGKVGTSE